MAGSLEGSVFGAETPHEQVVFSQDPASGLRAIIAIYSTALGPALGGTRFYPYATEADAVRDVQNLSRRWPTRRHWPGSTWVAARR